MDELSKIFEYQGGQGDQISLVETLVAMGLSAFCSMMIAYCYRGTHKGTGYSQNYTQSLVLLSLVTTLIMIVIGSNIARAFSLVGALSIIRFRNAVKETRDVAFIFFAMAIAMACGTRFYSLAMTATVMNCLAMFAMFATNFAKSNIISERLIRVQFPPNLEPEKAVEGTFPQLFQSWNIVSMESVRQGLYKEVVYSVQPLPSVTGSEVLDRISHINGNLKISYDYANHTEEL
ncbi:MAG: DUF4956 domain-containing protein [Planctomycetota bacterium]